MTPYHIELWQPCDRCNGSGYTGFAYCACCHGTSPYAGYKRALVELAAVLRRVYA